MSVTDWKEVLGWSSVPMFGEIHKLEARELKASYYLPANVLEVVTIIKNSLKEGFGFTNKRIIGEPGAGKTTFIYYIKKCLSTGEPGFRDYSFHILHLNRLRAIDHIEDLVEKRTLKLLADYFEENGLSQEYHTLLKEEPQRKEQINKLEDFILYEERRFKRKLIVLVDDIDETEESDVEVALRYFYGLLECHHICKWLIVRNTTLDHYKKDFLGFIDTKFGQSIKFPRVDLHGILATRIKALNPKGGNPFTQDICGRLVEIFNLDLRQACAAVPSFLEQVSPLPSGTYSDSFIGQYFGKNFSRVMTASQVFPNIYYSSQLRYIPLEKDVLCVIALYNEFPKEYLVKLANYYREAYKTHSKGRYSGEAYIINFDMRHINNAIEYLKNHRLVESESGGLQYSRLTSRGMSLAQFVGERVYNEYCHAECEGGKVKKHPMFWVLAKRLLSA